MTARRIALVDALGEAYMEHDEPTSTGGTSGRERAPGASGRRTPVRAAPGDEGTSLRLRPMPAPSAPSFRLTHPYFEIAYAPLLGPTAVALARALARHIDAADGPTTVAPVQLALELGLRASSTEVLGKRSHLVRALDRLAHAHVVDPLGDRTLGVHLFVRPLRIQTLRTMPLAVQEAHTRYHDPARGREQT